MLPSIGSRLLLEARFETLVRTNVMVQARTGPCWTEPSTPEDDNAFATFVASACTCASRLLLSLALADKEEKSLALADEEADELPPLGSPSTSSAPMYRYNIGLCTCPYSDYYKLAISPDMDRFSKR